MGVRVTMHVCSSGNVRVFEQQCTRVRAYVETFASLANYLYEYHR